MAIVRFNPVNEFSNLQREVNRLFTEFFPNQRRSQDEFESAVWRPMVDVHEDADSYTVDIELPGLQKEDVKINFQDGALTIAGERKYEYEKKDDGENGNGSGNGTAKKGKISHRIERSYGKFIRTFNFPAQIDAEKISAKFNDGVLKVVAPKAEEVKPRAIEIV